ncbi:DNA-binding domain-containing protein [Paenibacillus aurantius]|uniref:DNA-binding domain-containing protein n=1 Tax=Paenibacillus aurantius TaxID=2918900 RepID=A0AA96LFV0_9BACL|nr:DNA-binding domain-containing protein [Paenibacillus aurantius]WNQ11236.1 DNA-binding domain-containing protein [Paenibacillus aurantius]
MRFYIVDDDPAVRHMLAELIEDEELGTVAGKAADGSAVEADMLALKKADVLLIDLLMPGRDGIETVRSLGGAYTGKIIMLSQVESKDMIAEAYSLGLDYYITKPINRVEVVSVIRKVAERLQLERSIHAIRRSLSGLPGNGPGYADSASAGGSAGPAGRSGPPAADRLLAAGRAHLAELGLIGEAGSADLLDMLRAAAELDRETSFGRDFPALKDIFERAAVTRLGPEAEPAAVQKEVKAAEQRVRRALQQALAHLASLGLTDFGSPVFEAYAAKYFDFTEVRKKMLELEQEAPPSSPKLNIKKFLQVLYYESKPSSP